MNSVIRFHRGLLAMPARLQVWVGMLVVANLVVPFFYLHHIEAKVTLAVGLIGLVLMSGLTGRFGFGRIVGLGHVGWIPLIVYLLASLGENPSSTAFGLWLRTVIVLDAISLVFDATDAVRFVRGDREETVAGLTPPRRAVGTRA